MKIFTKDSNEEVIEIKADDTEVETFDAQFTEEEIASLKKLLPVADQLLALLEKHANYVDPVNDTDETKVTGDEDEDEDDTTNDSFGSIGAVGKATVTTDSLDADAKQLSIEEAWNKRYGRK